MAHDMLFLKGENRLTYGDYNSAGWASTGDQWAMTNYPSLGRDGMARVIVNDDNTLSYVNMAQTWAGTQTVRTTTAANFTGATNVCFWIEQGVHQRESHLAHQLQMGTCDSVGANQQEWYNETVTSEGKRWFSVPLSSVTLVAPDAICFYFTLTDLAPDGMSFWWAQWAGASDSATPGNVYYKSAGAPIIYATDQVQRVVQDTCADHREKVFAYRNLRGKARKETDPIVPLDTWEG